MTTCPACGFELGFEPWQGHSASDEICPCCWIQFGYDDCAGGNVHSRQDIYDAWRQKWIAEGMLWRGTRRAPEGWNAVAQLRKAELAYHPKECR